MQEKLIINKSIIECIKVRNQQKFYLGTSKKLHNNSIWANNTVFRIIYDITVPYLKILTISEHGSGADKANRVMTAAAQGFLLHWQMTVNSWVGLPIHSWTNFTTTFPNKQNVVSSDF